MKIGPVDCDVAIIGYGPVGAALANLLGMSGLRVAVLEREPSLHHLPRAVSLDGEGMRLFQTIGLADTLLPKLNVSRNIRHVNAEGKLLLLLARGGIGPDGWNHAYRFYQPELEAVLREGVARFPGVDVRLRHDVFALDECDDHIRVRYENLADGRLSDLTARYVVGCDGARSTVRRFMGAALQDLRSHERWIVLDMILDTPPAGIPEAADESGKLVDAIQYCDPARPVTFVPMPGKRHRWEFMLMPPDDPATIVQAGRDLPPARTLEDRARALADRARGGLHLPLLVGDAMAARPAAARGRCRAPDAAVPRPGHGLRPARRDQSRLEAAGRRAGQGTDGLLDSYETERMEHVRAYIELAVELGSVIQATDPEKARRRDAELLANPTMLRPLAPRLGPGLHGDAGAPAGTRAEQPRLADGRRLDDHVGYRFALLAAPALVAALPACTRQKLEAIEAVIVRADGEAAAYLERLDAAAVVIRPDRHILGIASSAPELDRVLARVHA